MATIHSFPGSNREATDFLGVMIEDEGAIKYSSFQWSRT
jgi:hypothetical protein